jgi:ATP-binding cassette subfamily F protein uup
MDRLVDHLFIFEGDGVIRDFPGNYSQYREAMANGVQSGVGSLMSSDGIEKAANTPPEEKQTTNSNKRQLSYKEKREFELLEKEIADLTKEKETITKKLTSGKTPFEELKVISKRIGEVTRLLDEKELRWLELSEVN